MEPEEHQGGNSVRGPERDVRVLQLAEEKSPEHDLFEQRRDDEDVDEREPRGRPPEMPGRDVGNQ